MTEVYRPRGMARRLAEALEGMPVVVLTGMRQVGKTTLLRRDPAFAGRRYVSLDDFAQFDGARRDPEGFLAKTPVTIDEAQRCPELLAVIKRIVDRDRRPGRFLLSGSANFPLLSNVAESLAGRAVYLPLHPFSRREIEGRGSAESFLSAFFRTCRLPRNGREVRAVTPRDVLRGGLPPVCLGLAPDPGLWFRGFEQTYVERDLRALSQVADLVSFRHLLVLAALRSGQVLNVSGLARDARLNAVTTRRYLDLLEASFLVERLAPFLGNRAARLIKSPKLYFSDSGLACHLAGVADLAPAADEPLRGAAFETYAAANLAGVLSCHAPDARLSYWNVQGRHEVDFVVQSGRDVIALEVKAGTRWAESDLRGLRAFAQATPRCRAAILAHNGTDAVSLGDGLWAIPLAMLLS